MKDSFLHRRFSPPALAFGCALCVSSLPKACLAQAEGDYDDRGECALASPGVAEGPMTLSRAVELALRNNASIKSAAATVQVRLAQRGQARSEYWPTLSVTTSEVREDTRYPGSSTPSSSDTAITGYGAFGWRLFDFGGRNADSRAAVKFLEAAISTQSATVQKVLDTVIENYFDAVTAKALLNSKTDDRDLAQQTLASADRRLALGDGAQSDILQAKTALSRAQLDSNRAKTDLDKALAVLAYDIGLVAGVQYSIPDEPERAVEIEKRSLSDWLEETSREHPAIVAARADLEAAEAQVVSARSAGRPTIDLQANYYANGFPQQGLATTRQRSATIGISVTIPIFDGFLTRYRVREARANVSQKEATLLDTERTTLSEVVKTYSDAVAAVENLRDSQNLLEAAQAALSSSRRRYEAGATDIVELLATQAALSDARQARVQSLAEWRSARLRLLATSGILSLSSID